MVQRDPQTAIADGTVSKVHHKYYITYTKDADEHRIPADTEQGQGR